MYYVICWSPSSQRVWIEIRKARNKCNICRTSPSSQRVWIEIYRCIILFVEVIVALFTEGVDWNWSYFFGFASISCRPLHRGCGLKWGVPDLLQRQRLSPSSQRVWIEIMTVWHSLLVITTSPSSQRVWIEMAYVIQSGELYVVALFTEGVDWNLNRNMTDTY